jgi:hypothetical protein
LAVLWKREGDDAGDALAVRVQSVVEAACAAVLARLYPQSRPVLAV